MKALGRNRRRPSVAGIHQQLEETRFLSTKDNFDPLHLIKKRYSPLCKYASRMLPTLQFRAAPAAMQPVTPAKKTGLA